MTPHQAFSVAFFRLDSGKEPVLAWLKSQTKSTRRVIGEDIKTLQLGWPVGMPLARKMADNLWELRSRIASGIARIFFTVIGQQIILLHAFIKKAQKTPARDLTLAKRRLTKLRS